MKRFWWVMILAVLLLAGLTIPAAAQDDTSSDMPFIYYYARMLGGFVIERADGTDSMLLQQSVEAPCRVLMYEAEWSASGRWLLWKANPNPSQAAAGPTYRCAVRYDDSRRLDVLEQFNGDNAVQVAWSPNPDSDLLAIYSMYRPRTSGTENEARERSPAVYIVDAERGEIVREVPLDRGYMYLEWSPDGQYLFVYEWGDTNIIFIPLDGTPAFTRQIDYETNYASHRLAWTPDGRLIHHKPDTNILLIEDLHTGDTLELPFSTYHISYIEWSADGTHAAVFVWGGENENVENVWLLSLTDQTLQQVADHAVVPYIEDDYLYTLDTYLPSFPRQIWSPDGTRALFAGTDGALYWLNAADGSVTEANLPHWEVGEWTYPLIQWGGEYAFVVWNNITHVYDLAADQVVAKFEQMRDDFYGDSTIPLDYAVSPDGRYMVYIGKCGDSRGYCALDWAAGNYTYFMPGDGGTEPYGEASWYLGRDIVFLGEVATAIGSGSGSFWAVATPDGRMYRHLTEHVHFSPAPLPENTDTSHIPHTDESVVPGPTAFFQAYDYNSKAAAWSPDGRLIATVKETLFGGYVYARTGDNDVRVWDANRLDLIAQYDLGGCPMGRAPGYARPTVRQEMYDGVVIAFDWSTDNTALGLVVEPCRGDDLGIIWEITTGEIVAEYPKATALAFGPGGNQIALGHPDGTVTLLDYPSGAEVATFAGPDHAVWQLDFNADGSRLVAAFEGNPRTVQVWDMTSGESLFSHELPNLLDADLSPDGRLLAAQTQSASYGDPDANGGLIVFDVDTGETLYDPNNGGTALAFSPDGRYLAATGGGVGVWETDGWTFLKEFHGSGVDVAWHPNGQQFMTATSYGVYFWDWSSPPEP